MGHSQYYCIGHILCRVCFACSVSAMVLLVLWVFVRVCLMHSSRWFSAYWRHWVTCFVFVCVTCLTCFATGSVSGMNGALCVPVVLSLLLRGLLLALWSYPAVSMSTLLLLCLVLMGVLHALGCCRQSSWATPSSLHVHLLQDWVRLCYPYNPGSRSLFTHSSSLLSALQTRWG